MVRPRSETTATPMPGRRSFRAARYKSPVSSPKSIRAPTLRRRLPSGRPLIKGENSWSEAMT